MFLKAKTLFFVMVYIFFFSAVTSYAEELPFVYQGSGESVSGKLGFSAEIETAVGTRDTRPFGKEGFENVLRFKYSPTKDLTLQINGGMVFTSGGFDSSQFGANVDYKLLKQNSHFVNLSLGAGFVYDYWKVGIPTVRASLWRKFGRFTILGSSLFEFPIVSNRDTVDMIVSVAGSFDVNRYVKVGAEVMGEDLEGFWDEDEAEGGAKIVVGPTLWLGDSSAFYFKLNLSSVVPATSNSPTYGQESGLGVLARAVVGYSF